MKIAFCTTCRNRLGHLSRTLPRNLFDNADFKDAVFVVADYGDDRGVQAHLEATRNPAIRDGKLVIYRVEDAGRFHMAHAKNVAHRAGLREGADVLVNVDADNWMMPGFARWLERSLTCDPSIEYMWTRMIKGVLPRGVSGRIVVTRNAFLKVGGYDERFADWARDDKDFCARLGRLGCHSIEINHKFLNCIRHTDGLRFQEYPHARDLAERYDITSVEGDDVIVNAGCVGLATVYRNGAPDPISIKPIPTRIFGIGLHKTATLSLHTALTKLRFDSAHWTSPQWSRTIWSEMLRGGRSPTLERHYALSDLPIAILYKELDRAYPGSKFILTTRDEDKWAESARKHWTSANEWRHTWDGDGFTHFVHWMVYGRTTFDEPTFRLRYRRHNAEVRAYFANRPGDLLEMKMDEGAGWPELCGFLDCAQPMSVYPKVRP